MITPSFGLTATERVLPKLALDFTVASLDTRITFTRETDLDSPATYVNSSGYITSAINNQPRFDYDPVAIACKGLLIEESRTNLFLFSNDFDGVSWTKFDANLYTNTDTSPEGVATAWTHQENNALSAHYFTTTVSVISGSSYSISLFAKQAQTTPKRYLTLLFPSARFGLNRRATFDLEAGTFNTVNSPLAAAMESFGGGWYRCSISATATSTGTASPQFRLAVVSPDDLGSYQGDGTSGVYVFGAQCEAGAFPTSYMPTESSAVTRNADVATMTGANFSDWFNASQGTLCATGTTFTGQGTASYANALFAVTDNVNDFCCLNRYVNAASGTVRNSGVTQATFTVADGWLSGETHSAAIAYKDADFGYALDGVAEAPVTSGSIPAGVDRAYIGRSFDGSDFRTWNGHVRELFYYPQRLTDAELAAITA